MAGILTGRRRGFTLIELLVALAILGAVLLPFLGFVSYRLQKERENDDLIKALEIGRSSMEQIMLTTELEDGETVIENRFLVKTEVFVPEYEYISQYPLREIRITVQRLRDGAQLVRLCSLR